MKRVKAAAISQTLVFCQKPDLEFSHDEALKINREEYEHYKMTLIRSNTRHVIVSEQEEQDGSITVRVIKQYNDKADVDEYFKLD